MAGKEKLSDDTVEYRLFPPTTTDNTNDLLEENIDRYLAFISNHVVDYIWQNEPFNLAPVSEGDHPPHLYGRTNFGDNIDDEWFIVYLLFKLTKQFPGLAAKVTDSDDEFLLIEAADYLPKWIKPDTSENRVFIFNGELHIIPRPQTPAEITTLPTATPSVRDAVKCIRDCNSVTKAGPKIQKAINDRVNEFPSKMKENVHHANCYIPANLAAVLEKKPSLISAGIQAFYYRDPVDLRACRTMQYFRPGTRVVRRVRFTRCLYAQLMQQRFQPDKRCGFVLPSTANPKFTSHDLGTKLAHGFEILCSKCNENRSRRNTGDPGHLEDSRWNKFVHYLSERGYFKGEIQGSKKYQELTQSAKEFYTQVVNSRNRKRNHGDEVLELLDEVTYDIEAMRKAEADLPPPDDDSWINLTQEALDEIISKRSSFKDATRTDQKKDTFDLSKVADSMKAFVEKVSDVEGAEFPGAEEDEDIQFDSTGFISSMQKMFEFDDGDSQSSSDMEEYGWDDSDIDVDDQPPSVQRKKQSSKSEGKPSVKDYMELMDKELAKTEVGKSFEKTPNKKSEKPNTVPSQNGMKEKKKKTKSVNDEDDEFQPVNIDVNIVKNMLDSLNAQAGLAGPASNILGTMGIKVPPPEEEDVSVNVNSNATSQEKTEPITRKRSSERSKPPPRPTKPPVSKPTDLPVPPSDRAKPPPRPKTPPVSKPTDVPVPPSDRAKPPPRPNKPPVNKPTDLPVPPPRHYRPPPPTRSPLKSPTKPRMQRQESKETNV